MMDLKNFTEWPESWGRQQIVGLLGLSDPADLQALYDAAYAVKVRHVGRTAYFRGIIECSNLCVKNCIYCGIRRDNKNVPRFSMAADELIAVARWAHSSGYGSIVLQAGERRDEEFVEFVAEMLTRIHAETNGELGVTLSLGEQDQTTFRRWADAGAHRYLLRIETTNRAIYRQLHPNDHDWAERLECLARLRAEGYQVGTGVLIGLPDQTLEDLAEDLLFFRDQDVDMIGMGPFIPHANTPLGHLVATFDAERQLQLGLKMIAVARLLLGNVNIAATTALQALDPIGRELGLLAGGNIVMPNITDTKYRKAYQLYEGKPSLDENSDTSRDNLAQQIANIGETVGYGRRGDSPRFLARAQGPATG